jgi:hypothetical protein
LIYWVFLAGEYVGSRSDSRFLLTPEIAAFVCPTKINSGSMPEIHSNDAIISFTNLRTRRISRGRPAVAETVSFRART